MHETAGIIPVDTDEENGKTLVERLKENEEKPQPKVEKHETKEVDISSLTSGQCMLLRDGMKDAADNDIRFNALGFRQKEIFHTTCDMFNKEHKGFKSITMLNLLGEEYWRAIDIPNQKKKEQQRFIKFKFDYVIPGTSNRLSVVKEWRYEDFTP